MQSLQSDNISIYEVTQNKLANDDTVKGIILRDEKLVRAKTSGYINYYVAEGAYVGVNTTVYSTDSSGFLMRNLIMSELTVILCLNPILRLSVLPYQNTEPGLNCRTIMKLNISDTILKILF